MLRLRLTFLRPACIWLAGFLVTLNLGWAQTMTPIQAAWAAEDLAQVEQLAKAMTKGDEAAEGWRHLSLLENAKGNSKQGLKHAEKAVELAPENAQMHIQLGSALNERIDDANVFAKPGLARRLKTAFETALELEPDNVRAINAIIRFHHEAPGIVGGDKEEIPIYRARLWEVAPLQAAIEEATPAMHQGDFARARALLARAREAEPEALILDYQDAKLAALSGENLAPAQTNLEAYLELPDPPEPGFPSHAGALFRLGQIYAHQGNTTGARTAFERSIALDANIKPLVEPELAKLGE